MLGRSIRAQANVTMSLNCLAICGALSYKPRSLRRWPGFLVWVSKVSLALYDLVV